MFLGKDWFEDLTEDWCYYVQLLSTQFGIGQIPQGGTDDKFVEPESRI